MTHPLRHYRKATDRTLEEAAKLLGITAATLSRWETGKRCPAPERVADISKVTGIPPHKLRPDIYQEPAA